MEDATSFIKESLDKLLKTMSKEHRHNAIQFSQYVSNTLGTMDRMDCYYRFLLDAELVQA